MQPIFYPVLGDPQGQKLNVELKIRKEGGGAPPRSANGGPNGNNMEHRGRNNQPGAGMNRNGSGGRGGDRRDGGQRQFQRSDRPMGRNGPNNTNGPNTAAPQHVGPRR